MTPVHSFPGVAPFIEEAAAARGFTDLRLIGKAQHVEHASRVQAALGQAVAAPREHQAEILADADSWRESLALALDGIDRAIADVKAKLAPKLPGPPVPAERPPVAHIPQPVQARPLHRHLAARDKT